jgi:hypothetical protein
MRGVPLSGCVVAMLRPETRVAMALSEKYKVALEEYDDFGNISPFLPVAKQSHQLFAVVDINTRVVGIEVGVGDQPVEHLIVRRGRELNALTATRSTKARRALAIIRCSGRGT